MPEYRCEIGTAKLIPSFRGTDHYRAFVEYIFEFKGESRTRIQHDFGETYGRTEEEAQRKMKEKVESWKAEQG